MGNVNQGVNLSEAANYFISDLPPEERGSSQQGIYKFIRWFGREQPFARLTAAEVASYAEQLSLSDTDYMKKLELIRTFLVYAKKKGWSKTNLATHLKARRAKARRQASPEQGSPEPVFLTRQGYGELEAELAALQSKRAEAIDEIRKAAADKDFRENAPLEAAREYRGHLEGRIMELEETLKLAALIEEKQEDTLRVSIGNNITLHDLDSGEELHYMLVSTSEVDPVRGMISNASPIGKAITGKGQGEIVEVAAPAGKLRYQIKRIEQSFR